MQDQQSNTLKQCFINFFQKILQKQCSNLNMAELNHHINSIYDAFFIGESNEDIDSIFQSIIENSQQCKKFIDLWRKQTDQYKKFHQNFLQNIIEDKSGYKPQQLQKDTFSLFLGNEFISGRRFQQNLKSYDLQILDSEVFYQQQKQALRLQSLQQYKKRVLQILQKNTDFNDFRQDDRQFILILLTQRKQKYDQVRQLLQDYDIENVFEVYQNKAGKKRKIQSENDFNMRVKGVLSKYCTKIKKLIDQKVFLITSNLYKQSVSLQKNQIIQILTNSGLKEFSKPENVTFQILKQIYLLDNQNQLKDVPIDVPKLSLDDLKTNQKSNTAPLKIPKIQNIISNQNSSQKQIFTNKDASYSKLRFNQPQMSRISSSNYQSRRKTNNTQRQDFIKTRGQPEFEDYQSQRSQRSFKQRNKKIYTQQSQQYAQEYSRDIDDPSEMKKSFLMTERSFSGSQRKETRKKDSQAQIIRRKTLQQQIQSILKKTQHNQSIQVILRSIQLQILKQNDKQITKLTQKLVQNIKKYQLQPGVIQKIQQLSNKKLQKSKKYIKINQIRRDIESLNLEQIFNVKDELSNNKDCKNAQAIVIIGETGVGKSTLLVGMSGQKLFLTKNGEYQPKNPEVAKKYVISKSTASVTRWANISKVSSQWIINNKILLIDTPGLCDNRGPQTDITNNLGTVQLLKNLQYVRIVIVLSKLQFKDRSSKSLKQIIIQISNYLYKIQTFKKSIVFVLTKGLKARNLLQQLQDFLSTSQAKKYSWTQNEKKFTNIMRTTLKKLLNQQYICQLVEINDPSSHNYQQLVEYILDSKYITKVQPQDSFYASYSSQTTYTIQKTCTYIDKMVYGTFQRAQFILTKYYLKLRKQLQSIHIYSNSKYIYIQQSLKQKISNKHNQAQRKLVQYLQNGSERYIKDIKQINQFLKDKQMQDIYKQIYQNSPQQIPIKRLFVQNLVNKKINIAKQKIQQDKQIKKQERNQIILSLKLIHFFKSEKQYKAFLSKNKQRQKQLQTLMLEEIYKEDFKKQNWDLFLKEFFDRFSLQVNSNGDSQKETAIVNIIAKYLKVNPKKQNYIKMLMDESKKRTFDGKLYELFSRYFKKLTVIKQATRSSRQIINQQVLRLTNQLQKLIIFYQQQQQKSLQTLDLAILKAWEVYEKNKQQIYKTLFDHDDTMNNSTLKYRYSKQQQTTFNSIEQQLKKCIRNLQNRIRHFNPENINLNEINQNIDKISRLNQFIKRKKQVEQKTQNNIRGLQNDPLSETIKKAENQLKKIQEKIQQIGNQEKILKYQVNYKLIICLLVLKKFNKIIYKQDNTKERLELQGKLKQKLLKPFNQLKTVSFKKDQQFQLIHKVLRYYKKLENKVLQLGGKRKDFEELFQMSISDDIQKKIKQGFQMRISDNIQKKIKQGFNKLRNDYDKIKWIVQSSNKQQFKEQQLKNNINSSSQQPKQAQQKEHISSQRMFTQDLLNSSKTYIICFRKMLDIVIQFSQHIEIIQTEKEGFETQYDLFQQIVKKIETFQQNFNSYLKSNFTRQQLNQTNKQLKFLLNLYNQTKHNNQKDLQFLRIKNKLDEKLDKCITNFQNQFQAAKGIYIQKNIRLGQDLQDLRKLVKDVYHKDKTSVDQVLQLMKHIQRQYDNIIQQYDAELNEKIGLLYSVSQFKKISDQMKYKYSFNEQMLKMNLTSFFNNLYKRLQYLEQLVKSGHFENTRQIRQLLNQQNKIQKYFLHQYKQYKLQKNKIGIKQWVQNRQTAIILQIQNSYMNENYIIDQKYKEIFEKTSAKNKQKMKKHYLQRNRKEIKQLQKKLENDHEQFQVKLRQKYDQIQKVPQEVCKQIKSLCERLSEVKNKQIQQFKQKSIKYSQQKNLFQLLSLYQLSQKRKNQQMNSIIINSFQQVYIKLFQQLNFDQNAQMQKNIQLIEYQFKFNEAQNFKKAITTGFKSLDQQNKAFVNKIKQQVTNKIKVIHQNFLRDNKKIIQSSNNVKNFKICQFKSIQSNGVQQFLNITKLLTKFVQIFIQEKTKLFNKVKQIVKDTIKNFNQNLSQFQNYIQKFGQIDENGIEKDIFSQFFYRLNSNKGYLQCLFKIKNIQEFSEVFHGVQLQKFDSLFKKLQQIMIQKYKKIINWSIQQILTSDTQQRKKQQIQRVKKSIQMIQNFHPMIFSDYSLIPSNILQLYQQKNKAVFLELQKKTIQDIQRCFKFTEDADGQNVRKFYQFQKLINKNRKTIFPPNMDFTQNVSKFLVQKYQQNISKIKSFIYSQQNSNKFNELLKQQKVVNDQELQKISVLQIQYQKKNKQIQNTFKIELESKLKAAQNSQNKDAKKQQITKQIQADKSNRFKDIAQQQFKAIQMIKLQATNKRQKITRLIQRLIQQNLVQYLIILSYAKTYFNCQDKILKYSITLQELLLKLQKNYSKKMMKYIYKLLKQNQNPYSQSLIDSQKIFKTFRATVFAEETKGQTFDSLIKSIPKIQDDSNVKSTIMKRFQLYEKQYKQILDKYKYTNDHKTIKNIITEITIKKGKQLSEQYKNQSLQFQYVISLLAHIFGLWTILEAEQDDQNNVTFIFQPHSGQILAIFLLLGINQSSLQAQIQNKIIQVSTGEGKSVLLGALSAYLALCGFQVYQACYSKYLSSRDYIQFKDLFVQLRIHQKIHYDIFPQICKIMLDQGRNSTFISRVQKYVVQGGSTTHTFLNYLFKLIKQKPKQKDQSKRTKKILLIDQVDVFLDQNYIGESYCPSISIKKQSVNKLFDFIWSKREQAYQLQPHQIINSASFKQLCKDINNSKFHQIMKNQVNAMIRDLQSYKNDTYSLIDGKIYYKQGDGLSDKIHYGYRTIFTHYHEHFINKRVSALQLSKHSAISLIAASFSYLELPKYFDSILSVTGTYESMSKQQKNLLQSEFNVKINYIQPSIYPPTRRKVNFIQCTSLQLFQFVAKNVQQQHAKHRPIIVFFKSKAEVYSFYHSKQFAKFMPKSTIITYEIKQNERDHRITTSCQQNKITLLTADFARGTDFKLNVKDKQNHPGLHVISAFIPFSSSQYIQIIGRTGRQGRNGTATLFIPSQSLAVSQGVILSRQKGQKIIKNYEDQYWNKKIKQLKQKIITSKKQHDQSLQVYCSSGTTTQKIFKNLYKLNQQRPITSFKSKTIICIDGTGSMSSVFQKVKQVIKNAMPDIYQAIDGAKVKGQFQIAFVIYRNYNSPAEEILQHSNFENKSEPLLAWLKGTYPCFGMGCEAIEVALSYINKLKRVDQLIVIGDAPANSDSDVKWKRAQRGQQYWKNNHFPLTTFDKQLQGIVKREIKCHSYYLNPGSTKSFFQKLSKKTGGIAQQFKIQQTEATKKFADFVAQRILKNLGSKLGDDAERQLLQQYANISSKKKYIGF